MMLDAEFWEHEIEEMYQILFPTLSTAAAEGVAEGAAYLGGTVGISWDLANGAAYEWARTYGYDLVKGINERTAAMIAEKTSAWIESGEPLESLIDGLSPFYGSWRAEMIAVTEATRAFSAGNQLAWAQSGVVQGLAWMTAEDELVCPICEPLGAADPYPFDAGVILEGREPDTAIESSYAPPAHVACRCFLRPIVVPEAEEYLSEMAAAEEEFALFDDAALTNHYSEYAGTLSEAELKALREYRGAGYQSLNSRLRNDAMHTANANTAARYNNLMSTIQGAPGLPGNGIVYRKIWGESGDAIIAKAKQGALSIGDILTDKAFVSTSSSLKYGAKSIDLTLRIKVPAGTKGFYYNALGKNRHMSEQELLFLPNTKMRILNIEFYEGRGAIFDVEIVK